MPDVQLFTFICFGPVIRFLFVFHFCHVFLWEGALGLGGLGLGGWFRFGGMVLDLEGIGGLRGIRLGKGYVSNSSSDSVPLSRACVSVYHLFM